MLMNSDPKSGESSESQLCAEVESIKTNVKPGESRESQLCEPEVKLLRVTHLPARHAKVVQAQISAGAVSSGTYLFMLEPGKCQSGESDVIVSTSVVQPNSDGYFKVLIENHGVCPVHLEAAHVVGSLSSVTEVPNENLPGLWDRQFEPVCDDKVDVTLCNLQPRVESLLQSVSVDWQSLDEADAVQLQSLIKDYANVFAMDHLELGRTELVQHVVVTGRRIPIKQPPRRIPFSLRPKVETLVVYLDDILVMGRSFAKRLSNLQEVFNRLRDANLCLKPKKCHFVKREVLYLGYVVSESGISADKSKVEAVEKFPVPTSVKQVRSFVGLTSYYRRFIPGFSKIAGPLFALTKKDSLFEWSPSC